MSASDQARQYASGAIRFWYRAQVTDETTLTQLMTLLERVHRDDLDSGYIRIVAEMVAGSVAHPELGTRIVALMEPWIEAARTAAERVLAPTGLGALISPRQLAFAAVTFSLGANLMSQLDPDSHEVEEVLATAKRLAPPFDALGGR